MVKFFVKILMAFCATTLVFSCTLTNSKPLLIEFSVDSSAIVFRNIDQAGLLQLKNAPAADSVFYDVLTVLQTPSEKDSLIKEMPVNGRITANDEGLVFVPEKPFVKGRDYLVITYLNSRFGNAEDIMKGKVHVSVKPLQKLLTR
ncbi:hypothetical protein CPT03_19470 [Pedobacter ginsengisoli]|uniref:Cyclophilin-like domain-containing protein n=1 Tax=Pedobacter ginsengisoli TaxID=363852 RepID=A0A2D1UA68_9SPHI|nr:hypothetical protein [Pedobacter ginsengisoli]ATP58486.1 hypothetical protein CPT03_19470 [Pedobacter ginsengisoli]